MTQQIVPFDVIKSVVASVMVDARVDMSADQQSQFLTVLLERAKQTEYTDELENTGQISDGYHTFDELYAHRSALFIALMSVAPEISWYSKLHGDGTMFDNMFIAGMQLPSIGQITYHLNLVPYWDLIAETGALHLSVAFRYDGHTSDNVLERLKAYATREMKFSGT